MQQLSEPTTESPSAKVKVTLNHGLEDNEIQITSAMKYITDQYLFQMYRKHNVKKYYDSIKTIK